jgi:hypothetical protein
MSAYQLAQLNIGVIRGPIGSAVMAEFVAALDGVNALAESSPGFVWRLQTEEGNATAIRPYPENDNIAVNLSVWTDVDSLRRFVFQTAHADFMRRRREWFEKMVEAYLVLWWVPKGHLPGIEEAKARLERLRREGPGPEAFTFRQAYPAPDAPQSAPASFSDECPAT